MKSTLLYLRSAIVTTGILLTFMVAQTFGTTWENISQEGLISGNVETAFALAEAAFFVPSVEPSSTPTYNACFACRR